MVKPAALATRAHASDIPIPREWKSHTVSGVFHAISLARFALMHVRGWFANSRLARVRLAAERDVARSDVAALREEARILRARVAAIEPRQRPRYPPAERLAILALRAARGWTAAETARRFLLTVVTVASWMKRLDDGGAGALVSVPEPVNRFPDFVGEIVRRMRASFPALGRKRLADVLARASVHLAPAPVSRMLKRKKASQGGTNRTKRVVVGRVVTAKAVHELWLVDLTLLPTVSGWWTAWFPFALLQRWPFCYWLGAVMDHVSRSIVVWKLFRGEPTGEGIVALLELARENAGRAPRATVSDKGVQFRVEYLAWCDRHGVKARFGAVGKHGSIAVIERFWRSLKEEMLRKLGVVPLAVPRMAQEIAAYVEWYEEHRPHQGLGGRTPGEVRSGVLPARENPWLEPRPDFPLSRGDPRQTQRRVSGLALDVSLVRGRAHLPIVDVRATG